MSTCRPFISIIALSFLASLMPAYAFPGQTAAEMVEVLGSPDNDYQSPPVPKVEQFNKGPVRLNAVHWRNAKYDPMRGEGNLRGVLVASFDYSSDDIVRRLSQHPPDIGWEHLISYTEVFLTYMRTNEFDEYLAGLRSAWRIESTNYIADAAVPYKLYNLSSCNGRYKAEISYAEQGGKGMLTMPDNSKRKSHNLWTRVTRID